MLTKRFLVLFLHTLVMITSIVTTIDNINNNDNNAYGQAVLPGYNPQYGSSGSETIVGTTGNDAQYGNGGSDILYGDQQSVYSQNYPGFSGTSTTTLDGGNDIQSGGDLADTSVFDQDQFYGDVGSASSSNYATSFDPLDGNNTATTTVQGGDDIQNAQAGDNSGAILVGDVDSARGP